MCTAEGEGGGMRGQQYEGRPEGMLASEGEEVEGRVDRAFGESIQILPRDCRKLSAGVGVWRGVRSETHT